MTPSAVMDNPLDTLEQVDADPFKQYGPALWDFVKTSMLTKIDYSRQTQLLLALRNNLMWQGKQYLKYSLVDGSGATVVPSTNIPGGMTGRNEPQTLAYVLNEFRSDGQKFTAILGGRVPYVTVTARDAQNPESLKQARDQRALAAYLDDIWDIEIAQRDLTRTLFRNGPCFGHICYTTDEKYGTVAIENTQVDKGIDDYGNTFARLATNQSKDVPRGMPELHLYSIFEVAIPPERKNIKNCEWLDCCVLESIGKLRNLYGDLVKHIQDVSPAGASTSSQETAGYAFDVITAAGPTRNDREDKWWWRRTWLTRDMYPLIKNEPLKDLLFAQAPDGIRLVFVNDNYVEAVPEKLTDVWAVCKTGTDDRIMGDPVGHDLVPFQNITNDFFNLCIETIMRAIPKTIVDARLIDRNAVQNNPIEVAELILSRLPMTADMSKMVAQLPMARFSDQLMPVKQALTDIRREVSGIQPALYGGGEPSPTFRQEQMRRNQAMQSLMNAWDETREFRANCIELAIRQLAKYGMGSIQIPSSSPFQFKPRMVDLTNLQPELVKIETDEKMPQNRVEQLDEFKENYAAPPPIQAAIGMFDPINIPKIAELAGQDDIISTQSHVVEKTLKIISLLVENEPTVGPDGKPASSVEPDPFDFDAPSAGIAAAVVRAYLNSPEGIELEMTEQPFAMNARLFGVACQKLAAPPPPPPTPPSRSFSISAPWKDLAPNQAAALAQEVGLPVPPPQAPSPAMQTEMMKPPPAQPQTSPSPPA